MKISSLISGAVMAGCALGVALAPRAAAMISDEDFAALKSMVTNQDQRIGQLEKLHEQDQQTHQQDQQTIQQLQQRLGETQTLATNAAQKAETAAQIQATRPRRLHECVAQLHDGGRRRGSIWHRPGTA